MAFLQMCFYFKKIEHWYNDISRQVEPFLKNKNKFKLY